ncbi:MAG TPA: NUDIX domain-containing protein [Streptosporangiaceae bacterium]|nr:NUDIX domain-containing protein [Streptosporangiaceae bacterium]
MANRDGNGWTTCERGHRHWGRYGAAGLLAFAPCPRGVPGSGPPAPDAPVCVLLQRRSWWGNHGGRWGPPGGARDSHESAVAAALREAEEECALPADAVRALGILRDDHGGWSYQTVIASAPRTLRVRAVSSETSQAAWVPVGEVAPLELHPGFAAQWPVLRETLQPLTIIVDGANVMGSRPDGWWRDRAGAARRLRDQLAALAAEGVAALPEAVAAPGLERWFPEIVLVVEGAARAAAASHAAGPPAGPAPAGRQDGPEGGVVPGGGVPGGGVPGGVVPGGGVPGGGVRVVAAPGSGDDTIAELAAGVAGRRLVVTADRQLRQRCVAAGASVTGPGWLLGLL